MLDEPKIATTPTLLTAVIRLTIPRAEIQQVMGPAIGETWRAPSPAPIRSPGAPN